ncbi:MAG: riboflavin synthase [Microcoleaceae cyanobacterium]
MFTGLIQALGTLDRVDDEHFQVTCVGEDSVLILHDLVMGDSVAVDGVCLTVTSILSQGFVAIASPETLRRTILGQELRQQGHRFVNLETSLRAGSKLGGHFVTGHVDTMGCLISSVSTGSSWEMRFGAPPADKSLWENQIDPFIVPKGSIAVNGISLTIADCDTEGNWFQVAVIPHTYNHTNLRDLKPGNLVNLEADILGKYVTKFLHASSRHHKRSALENVEDITPEFLAENGFM